MIKLGGANGRDKVASVSGRLISLILVVRGQGTHGGTYNARIDARRTTHTTDPAHHYHLTIIALNGANIPVCVLRASHLIAIHTSYHAFNSCIRINGPTQISTALATVHTPFLPSSLNQRTDRPHPNERQCRRYRPGAGPPDPGARLAGGGGGAIVPGLGVPL